MGSVSWCLTAGEGLSIWVTNELWPRFVLGPYSMPKLGWRVELVCCLEQCLKMGIYTYHVFDTSAVVCLRSFVPDITQLAAVLARELDGMHELSGLEASGAD